MPSTRQKRKSETSTAIADEKVRCIVKRSSIEKEIINDVVKPKKRTKREIKPKTEPAPEVETEQDVANAEPRGTKYWLMKAEPESRIVKGKVLFPIDETEFRMSNLALMILNK
jgi:hypothetical protein